MLIFHRRLTGARLMGEAIRSLLRSSSSRHRPRQIAAAIALGVLCGLLPKLSFIFCLMAAGCFLLPIHVPLGALVCVVCSLVTTTLAPLAGRLGIWSLTNPLLRDLWLAIDGLPLIPWLGLHNSIVNGSLLIGISLWLPVYLLSLLVGRWLAPDPSPNKVLQADPDFAQELRPFVATEQLSPERNDRPIEIDLPIQCMGNRQSADQLEAIERVDQRTQESKIYRELETLLENCSPAQAEPMSVEQVVERASQIAEYVDQLLTASEPSVAKEALPPAAAKTKPLVESLPLETNGHASGANGTLRRHDQHSTTTVASSKIRELPVRQSVGASHQQEALRYLLHHLKAFKDKV